MSSVVESRSAARAPRRGREVIFNLSPDWPVLMAAFYNEPTPPMRTVKDVAQTKEAAQWVVSSDVWR
jgi:hypothetical protein